mmetsp:Transcript_45683/g.60559  ORF Transcript_45683/g.60559 Transcript_45683/m.60559 type:complete len:252 (+) Transcript_45683:355-1110(+)
MLREGSAYMAGSIAPYIASYYNIDVKQAQIILPSIFVLNVFLSPIGAQLAQAVHPKILLFGANLVGISLLLIASYQSSFLPFCILYVLGFGINNALTYIVPVHHSWLWFPERPGLASGLIITGFGFGALIFNTVSLYVVNPGNESAAQDGKFSDEVNERFPYMLRMVMLCFSIMSIVAIALISPGPQDESDSARAQRSLDNSMVSESLEFHRSSTLSNFDSMILDSESARGGASPEVDDNSPENLRKRILR